MIPIEVPVFPGFVPAGFPSPAADYEEERIDLPKHLVPHPLSTFFFRSRGDSMINAFIPDKALLVVDKSKTAQNDDIVIGVVNGEMTVKLLRKNDHHCWLVPANKKYPILKITAEMDFSVWGVVTSIIIDPKDLQNICTP